MKTQKYLAIGNVIFGAILALTPFVVFPVCTNTKPDGTHMGCYYSGIFITIMGVLIVIFSLITIWREKFITITSLASAIAAVLCWLIPNRIIPLEGNGWICSLCGNPEHACRASTMPAVGIIIAIVTVLSVALLILNFVKRKH